MKKKVNFGLQPFKASVYTVLSILMVVLFTACSGSGSGDTLATLKKDMDFPNDVHQKLPIPEKTSLMMNLAKDGRHAAMVKINTPYPEVIEFYPERLKGYGWEIVEEDIPEETEGERTATWKIKGHGTEGSVNFTAFGGEKGMNMMANYHIVKEKD